MKKLVSMVMGLAAAAALAAPMPEYQVLTFSVTGAEKYADDSDLAAGECYALVWSADGVFEGINADGTAKGEGDEVIYIGTIVKDSTVVLQVADGLKSGGSYEIWILDTRVRVLNDNGENEESVGWKDGKGTITSAAKATASVTVCSASAPVTADSVESGKMEYAPAIDLASIEKPVIGNISFDKNGNVVLSVPASAKGATYAVQGSESPAMTNPQKGLNYTGTGKAIEIVAPSFGNFYNVIVTGVAK